MARPEPRAELRLGILGCGRIVRLAHLGVLHAAPGTRVAAIADADPAARALAARLAPGARVGSDMGSLLAEDLDAVVIAVPPLAHRDAAVAAFARGLHVYLEKPIATTVADAMTIIAAWERAGTIGAIGFNLRFNRLYQALRAEIAAGTIGAPVTVRCSFTARWPTEAPWRVDPSLGGGAMLELASHHIDLCRFLLQSEVATVSAATWSRRGPDEAAMLYLRLDSGVHVQMQVCYGTLEEDRFEVYGTEGKLVVDRYNSLVVEHVAARARGGIASAVQRLTREIRAIGYGLEKRGAAAQEPSYSAALRAFLDAVRSGQQSGPSLHDGLHSLRVIEAARSNRLVTTAAP